MTSQAVRDFCSASRDGDVIRARRRNENQQALQARRSAEQLLAECLGVGTRCQATVDDSPYVIAVKLRQIYPSFNSTIADKLQSLWDDTDTLRTRLEASDAEDVRSAVVVLLLEEARGEPRVATYLELAPLRQGVDRELTSLPAECGELATALVRAKADLDMGKAEYGDEAKRLQQIKTGVEGTLRQELALLEVGQVKRVDMRETDGSTQSYYLRLKRDNHKAAKRRITYKALKLQIEQLLATEVDSMQISASLETVCTPSFGASFLAGLKGRLVEREQATQATQGGEEEPVTFRVALDRIRAPRCRSGEDPGVQTS